jgi:hypothetical protein
MIPRTMKRGLLVLLVLCAVSTAVAQLPTPNAEGVSAKAADVSAWYEKWFSAKLGRIGGDIVGDIPGARIVFRETKDPIAPTKGHSLGLLGFEVKDIQSFVKKYLEAGGKFDGNGTIARSEPANLSVIQLTDPWGTSIEVSQGLAAVK